MWFASCLLWNVLMGYVWFAEIDRDRIEPGLISIWSGWQQCQLLSSQCTKMHKDIGGTPFVCPVTKAIVYPAMRV